jgi:hypothetical protein
MDVGELVKVGPLVGENVRVGLGVGCFLSIDKKSLTLRVGFKVGDFDGEEDDGIGVGLKVCCRVGCFVGLFVGACVASSLSIILIKFSICCVCWLIFASFCLIRLASFCNFSILIFNSVIWPVVGESEGLSVGDSVVRVGIIVGVCVIGLTIGDDVFVSVDEKVDLCVGDEVVDLCVGLFVGTGFCVGTDVGFCEGEGDIFSKIWLLWRKPGLSSIVEVGCKTGGSRIPEGEDGEDKNSVESVVGIGVGKSVGDIVGISVGGSSQYPETAR